MDFFGEGWDFNGGSSGAGRELQDAAYREARTLR
jgi:hypothetical protein